MDTGKVIICSDIARDSSRRCVELLLDDQETRALQECAGILDSKDAPRIISLVNHKGTFKIISAKRFVGKDKNDNDDPTSFYIENLLSDYVSYLDYLYLNGVDCVSETPLTLENFEILLKAIVSYYDVDIEKKDWLKLVKVTDKANGNLIFYSTEYTRPTFDVELLRRVRDDIQRKFEQARNKPSIEEIAKLLKNNPRPSMRINYNG